jgi:hypothetical protein
LCFHQVHQKKEKEDDFERTRRSQKAQRNKWVPITNAFLGQPPIQGGQRVRSGFKKTCEKQELETFREEIRQKSKSR